MHELENLKLLKSDMESNGWVIDSFIFEYKKIKYIVLVKLYDTKATRPRYALLKLEFYKEGKLDQMLETDANVNQLMIEAKTLREFFGIEYAENLGDILQEFNKYFGGFIPTKINVNKVKEQKYLMEYSLSQSDSEDPEKKYCFKVKRNGLKKDGTPAHRSPYNDNVTRLRRPELYDKLGKDITLSFCYSKEPNESKTDDEIISNWVNKRKS